MKAIVFMYGYVGEMEFISSVKVHKFIFLSVIQEVLIYVGLFESG